MFQFVALSTHPFFRLQTPTFSNKRTFHIVPVREYRGKMGICQGGSFSNYSLRVELFTAFMNLKLRNILFNTKVVYILYAAISKSAVKRLQENVNFAVTGETWNRTFVTYTIYINTHTHTYIYIYIEAIFLSVFCFPTQK
jgi:hypothetical protein